MTIKRFLVEVEYTPYEEFDPVNSFLIEEGVSTVVGSMEMDGEIEESDSVRVMEIKDDMELVYKD